MSIKALEQTAAVRLLLYLRKKGKASMSELKNNIDASNVAIYNATEILKKAGLVSDEYEKHFPRRRLVSLTPLGRKVAEKLAEIEAILAGKGGEGS